MIINLNAQPNIHLPPVKSQIAYKLKIQKTSKKVLFPIELEKQQGDIDII